MGLCKYLLFVSIYNSFIKHFKIKIQIKLRLKYEANEFLLFCSQNLLSFLAEFSKKYKGTDF